MRPVYVAFREGVFWNITHDEEVVLDWADRKVIECWQKYEPAGEMVRACDCEPSGANPACPACFDPLAQ